MSDLYMNKIRKTILEFDDFQRIIPAFRTYSGAKLLKMLIPLVGINKINELYSHSYDKRGLEFIDSILKELEITYRVIHPERLPLLPAGSFITVSNHPYGALDGILLIRLMAEYRADFKVMVNWILQYIDAMSDYFIPVHPISENRNDPKSVNGLKQSILHVREGHPLGFFPAGSVSKYDRRFDLSDREWRHNVIRLIRQLNVPVVPIYFHGQNSVFYNLLGLIDWRVRTLRLPWEVFNKKNSPITISVGEMISVDEMKKYHDINRLGQFLKAQTYRLQTETD